LLAHGQWFSPGTTASSTTKTGRHDIAEILLKVVLNTINQILICRQKYLYNHFNVSYIQKDTKEYNYNYNFHTYQG
jgi:hypothetical protein